MFANLKEAFQSPDDMNFRPELANLLGNTYPNMVPTSDDSVAEYANANKNDINNLTKEVVNGQFLSGGYDIASRFRPAVPRALRDRQALCKAATIDQAIAMVKPGEKIRCGWIYKNNTGRNVVPITDTGFLGDMNQPLSLLGNVPEGTYYPDPAVAKKQKMVDLCGKMTSCDDLAASAFAGYCAWSPEAGRAIPIEYGHARGNPLYPNDPLLMQGVITSNIIRTPGSCPPPPPPAPPGLSATGGGGGGDGDSGGGGGIGGTGLPDDCSASSTRISRACMLGELQNAQCTDQGTLYTALSRAADPSDLLAQISIDPAFKRYQERAPIALLRDQLKDGNITKQAALNNFEALRSAATDTTNENTSFGWAARELCNKSKIYENFDFCTEIPDSDSNYSLACAQKEFKKAGGIEKGAAYPTSTTIARVNGPTWGSYKAYVTQLAQNARSTDIRTQEVALRDLLGINRESLLPRSIVPKIDGYEIYVNRWRSNDDTIFMGRMFMDASSGLPIISNSAQIPALMGPADSSMVILTNLKPTSDVNVSFQVTGGTTNIIRAKLNNQNLANDQCKVLSKQDDNHLSIYYGQTAGTNAALRVNYKLCNQGQMNLIPAEWLKLTQEIKAPMISFEVNNSGTMAEFRQPENFRSMGNYVVENTPSNYQDAPNGNKFISITSTQNYWQMNKLVNIRAWNSLTFCFRINNNRAANVEGIFGYRFTQLSLGLTEGGVTFMLPDNTRYSFGNSIGSWYVCYISKQSSDGYTDNKYTVAIYPYETVVSGVSLNEPANVITKTFYRNVPIASTIESNGLFQFGADTASGVSSRFSLAWFHLFDYNLSAADLKTDALNGWKRVSKV